MSKKPYANALEEMRVRDLRETFDAAHYALNNPMASIPSDEWGSRKDMMCPDEEDGGLDFNRSGWSAEVIASGPLGVRPEDSIVLTASASAAIQQVLMELLQAATATPPAQAVDLSAAQEDLQKALDYLGRKVSPGMSPARVRIRSAMALIGQAVQS